MPLRILLLGPVHGRGRLPPYLDVLTDSLRAYRAIVTRLGSTEIPYDIVRTRFWPPARLRAAAATIANAVDPGAHDVIALHAGNLELDQLVPALLPPERALPIVVHVHTLGPTLLGEHSPEPAMRAAVPDRRP